MPDYCGATSDGGPQSAEQPDPWQQDSLLGLAYKANTSDLRESPALAVARRLLDLDATVCYFDDHTVDVDPAIFDQRLERVLLAREELARCETVAEHGHLVLDTHHRCRGQTMEYV